MKRNRMPTFGHTHRHSHRGDLLANPELSYSESFTAAEVAMYTVGSNPSLAINQWDCADDVRSSVKRLMPTENEEKVPVKTRFVLERLQSLKKIQDRCQRG